MTHERVVVTGIGVVSSVGTGAADFSAALRRATCGSGPITVFDTEGYESSIGCEVRDFDPEEWFRATDPQTVGKAGRFAVAAARMAMDDSGLDGEALRARGCGVCVGTTEGESQLVDRLSEAWVRGGMDSLDSDWMSMVPSSRISLAVAKEIGITGESLTIPTACAAGNYAIGHAFDLIRTGEAGAMLCGGADCMSRKSFSGFYRMGAVAPERCQPFDKDRKGILTGEGAGILLLESRTGAIARGARIYAEVMGYGLSCDANHPVAPDKSSIARCIRTAHANAGTSPGEVDYISAHGTGTKANDVTESGAITEVFGTLPPPVSSIKSMLGHTMGAASALSSAACALALHEGFIPPTINHESTDPACSIDPVANRARPASLRLVQNNAFAFFGNNAILILSRHEADRGS